MDKIEELKSISSLVESTIELLEVSSTAEKVNYVKSCSMACSSLSIIKESLNNIERNTLKKEGKAILDSYIVFTSFIEDISLISHACDLEMFGAPKEMHVKIRARFSVTNGKFKVSSYEVVEDASVLYFSGNNPNIEKWDTIDKSYFFIGSDFLESEGVSFSFAQEGLDDGIIFLY